jgi:hypothetical protein
MQTVGQAAGKSQDDPEGCRHGVAVRDIHMLDVEGSCKSTTRCGCQGEAQIDRCRGRLVNLVVDCRP